MEHCGAKEVEEGIEALLPRMWRFALSLTRNHQFAEDLVQDTCVRALDKAHLFQPGTHLDRWCFTVMANVHRSGFRKKVPEPVEDETLLQVPDTSPSPDKNLFSRQVLDEIDALPEAQRSVVILVYGEGFTYRETADIMNVPIGTIMSRLHTARERLAHLAE